MKKILSVLLAATVAVSTLVGCGSSGDSGSSSSSGSMEGKHVFMFKSTGNSFGDLMAEGFQEYIKAQGEEAVYKSPAETTVAAQVKLIDELITQKIASLTISTNGDTGYDEVLAKAEAAGIKVVSVDSKLDPSLRLTHIDPTSQEGIGSSLVQAATLIALGIDYPKDGDMEKATKDALSSYSGDEIKLGVLSASIDTPVQNGWIAKMEEELAKPMYKGKVNPELTKKYGNDDPTVSTTQANAFIAENNVDVIISPTTVGMAAAGQALKSNPNCKIKLTGLGLPSEMQTFMPTKESDNAFDFVCPYMMLWDVIDLGRVGAAATWAAYKDGYDGSVGSTFEMDAIGEYPARTMETIKHTDDDGSLIIVGNPYVFSKENMANWIDKL
ncbi:substrate-binding domain-containing protein [Clostridium sp. NSJ-6]|uniref:Substrate-binding domain-containing protein n=1 Tax=Clostridium hominis TaxID=2763036 RepID=A0ABR7DDH4_9CLOT|nr:substrate-binding domain-containing protein [Clostridium hominis]MBC5629445.1 substrate-binding domain-containing protein [Clostridium hominis]MDU2671343.1 substrate-binding domain-containing protein [Clostridium sp.]